MKPYRVVEMFLTLQGEGLNAGMPSAFVRFAGCNLWSGEDSTRARDAERHKVECPLWCDTDFRHGTPGSAETLALNLESLVRSAGWDYVPLIVLTGGEPLLQLDAEFLRMWRAAFRGAHFAIETNGTVQPKEGVLEALDHVCVSPKVPARDLKVRAGAELKVVYPAYDPKEYESEDLNFDHWYVTPEAPTESVGKSIVERVNMQNAARFCLENPRWRLSLQTHKILGIP